MQRKAERCYKELQTTTEEEHRQVIELQSLCEQLNQRIKTYKRQLEEAVSVLVLSCSSINESPTFE